MPCSRWRVKSLCLQIPILFALAGWHGIGDGRELVTDAVGRQPAKNAKPAIGDDDIAFQKQDAGAAKSTVIAANRNVFVSICANLEGF